MWDCSPEIHPFEFPHHTGGIVHNAEYEDIPVLKAGDVFGLFPFQFSKRIYRQFLHRKVSHICRDERQLVMERNGGDCGI
jgi:hypothetical protein